MQLQVTHTIDYQYDPAVSTAQHLACLLPRDLLAQRVRSSSLRIDPEPEAVHEHRDAFGNRRAFFALPHPHQALHIEAKCVVQPESLPVVPASETHTPPWEQVRDHFHYRAGAAWDAATEFAFASQYVPKAEAFEQFARPSFTAGRPVLEAAIDLMRRIHRDFEYASKSTDINTPALEALQRRQGVCQDFAHILLACLRTLGLSARYVSGYLLTVPPKGQPRLVGSDASHLKLRLIDNKGSVHDAIGFGKAAEFEWMKVGSAVKLVYEISENIWNDSRKHQLEIIDIKPNEQ